MLKSISKIPDRSISRALLIGALFLCSCVPSQQRVEDETASTVPVDTQQAREKAAEVDQNAQEAITLSFDPLDGPGERDNIPELFADSLRGAEDAESLDPDTETPIGTGLTRDSTRAYDTYRIQLFNSRVFTEAALEQSIAQEIFDYRTSLDYEVPYFKVRIGDFPEFKSAQRYLQEFVKPAGYQSSWVARVRVQPVKTSTFDEALSIFFDSLRTAVTLEESLTEDMPVDSAGVREEESDSDEQ